METLGKRISENRKAKNIKQDELAEMLLVSPQAVSKWENDISCPDISLLPKLSEILGISVDELLSGKKEPETKFVPEEKRKDIKDMKIIVCHLGNGSSISAVKYGESIDTSMGLTPLEGVPMGTRSGDIDPAILEFLAKKEDMDIFQLVNVLNKKSGVFGVSGGLSSDFRDLENAAKDGDDKAQLARDVFTYNVAKYVGAYAAAMNGVDAIAFTAGVGENDGLVRKDVIARLGFLGIELDEEANGKRGFDNIISTADSKVTVCVIPTNEELAIARETLALVK